MRRPLWVASLIVGLATKQLWNTLTFSVKLIAATAADGRARSMIFRLLAVYAALNLCAATVAVAQWAPGGTQVPGSGAADESPRIATDSNGGAWIVWADGRSIDWTYVYCQHLTSMGSLAAGCPADGIPVCTSQYTRYFPRAIADGQGGVFVSWEDARGIRGYLPCAQHIDASGHVASGWPVDGMSVISTATAKVADGPEMVSDGSGGAYFVWIDTRNDVDEDLYMQHLTASGIPAPGWSTDGMPLAAYAGDQFIFIPLLSDGAGGMFAIWYDGRPGAAGTYLQHIQPDGSPAPGWPPGGILVSVPGRSIQALVPDGTGGFYMALNTGSTLYPGADSTYYALRVNSIGQPMPGWPAQGLLVRQANYVAVGGPWVSVDAAGNFFLAWDDYRTNNNPDTYATEVGLSGAIAPGWQPSGNLVSTAPGIQSTKDVLADGSGGVFIAGEYRVDAGSYGYIQHLSGAGQPAAGWTAFGQDLRPEYFELNAQLVADAPGGTIAVWSHDYGSDLGLYANRFYADLATATLVDLQSIDARSDEVVLQWLGDGAASLAAHVERRTRDSDWTIIGTPVPESSDLLSFHDRSVSAGIEYGYRLAYISNGAIVTTRESWVTVPRQCNLALVGLTPNPARSSNMRVAYELATAEPARLEMMDVSGRRVLSQDVSGAPGQHVVPLNAGGALPVGLYWLKLSQGGRSRVVRAAIAG